MILHYHIFSSLLFLHQVVKTTLLMSRVEKERKLSSFIHTKWKFVFWLSMTFVKNTQYAESIIFIGIELCFPEF